MSEWEQDRQVKPGWSSKNITAFGDEFDVDVVPQKVVRVYEKRKRTNKNERTGK